MRLWPQHLLRWYRSAKREMPWRGHPDPYAVWLSEIMLQQTRVETVRPYFSRFLKDFPTISTLASAPEQALLKRWEGLGYYSRARNLHVAAKKIVASHHGQLPRSAAELATLPGIGPYTAAAIASICFGEHVPVVDGNVARVFARLLGWRDDFRQPAARRKLSDWLQPHIATTKIPGDFNQAMMELGALVCLPRTPRCTDCPLQNFCHAFRTHTQAQLPARPRSDKKNPVRHTVAVVIRHDKKILLVQPATRSLLAGLWQLPGGDVAKNPTPAVAAKTVRQQTGLHLTAVKRTGEITHDFSHFRQVLTIFTGRATGRLTNATPAQWADKKNLPRLPLATTTKKILGGLSSS
jgi:A/G-specific adenine glycosylase